MYDYIIINLLLKQVLPPHKILVMNTPLVSVIMPVYNREKYVGEAIQSILNQTITDLELIIVDDASTDNTLKVIKTFNDDRIKILKNDTNQGVSFSLNRAILVAKGNYLARQDSDDISLPHRIEKQVDFMENYQEINVCGSLMKSYDNSVIFDYPKKNKQIKASALLSYPMASPTLMFRKNVFKIVKFEGSLRFGEDYQWMAEAITYFNFYNIQEILVVYRIHTGQISLKNLLTQKKADSKIKLSLFKKIEYPVNKFSDEILVKFWELNKPITTSEFALYLNWLKFLAKSNKSQKVFTQEELDLTLKKIKDDLLFKIFHTTHVKGVNKVWRIKALVKLSINDLAQILYKKILAKFKSYK
jgi:glycosyltransferase involved in cell wall biosynthesis